MHLQPVRRRRRPVHFLDRGDSPTYSSTGVAAIFAAASADIPAPARRNIDNVQITDEMAPSDLVECERSLTLHPQRYYIVLREIARHTGRADALRQIDG